ncbi:MAG: ATP-grasp domain-containing protein [Proteobacteria bacterium]|nr:ATP-grasp domain-containing protein [Pseudomonadota bacterium]
MFKKILIANRGEIACRIIETCRRLGIQTVAVYSSVDSGSRHVKIADQSVELNETNASLSYLCGKSIIEAALSTGAEAIHPGYGFLSENPEFVELLESFNLIFIGPSADSIRSMGLKHTAKNIMETAGVPTVPGYSGSDQTNLRSYANEIGYPILIKAVAGGGGRGMRRVNCVEDFEQLLAEARSEAIKSFGNGDVLIEKYIELARHIEVQIFGDSESVISLFERDCSLQRRHQKVIEEAPAPGITQELRALMSDAAIRAARAVSYEGAGTVEFIVDISNGICDEKFYFMEMNTRLQVEHSVTEEILGIDLVEWQIRVSSGEKVAKQNDKLKIEGHAIEARIYAEDVPSGFLPATGVIEHLLFPKNVRVDTGILQGDEITTYYDPMIAKITAYGKDRDSALFNLRAALTETRVSGIKTNLEFLKRLLSRQEFLHGEINTAFIHENSSELMKSPFPATEVLAIAAVFLHSLKFGEAKEAYLGFSLWEPLLQSVNFHYGQSKIKAILKYQEDEVFIVEIEETTHHVSKANKVWVLDGEKMNVSFWEGENKFSLFTELRFDFEYEDPLNSKFFEIDEGGIHKAPMPGQITLMDLKEGDEVQAGEKLMILESMKMEHAICSQSKGRVEKILVSDGQRVNVGDIMVTILIEK